jgi:hypothetical protein
VVALVIDDWGYRVDATTSGLLALDAPLTLAVLPGLSFSRRFALEASELALPPAGGVAGRGEVAAAASRRLAAGCPVTLGLGAGATVLERRRREVILHLPMQPQDYPRTRSRAAGGPGGHEPRADRGGAGRGLAGLAGGARGQQPHGQRRDRR